MKKKALIIFTILSHVIMGVFMVFSTKDVLEDPKVKKIPVEKDIPNKNYKKKPETLKKAEKNPLKISVLETKLHSCIPNRSKEQAGKYKNIRSMLLSNFFMNDLKKLTTNTLWKNIHIKLPSGTVRVIQLEPEIINGESKISNFSVMDEDEDGFPWPVEVKGSKNPSQETIDKYTSSGTVFYTDHVYSLAQGDISLTLHEDSEEGVYKFSATVNSNYIECENENNVFNCHCI